MRNTILLVDDEPAILNSLKRMLHSSGYKVLAAGSGPEALQILEENQEIQVVLTDYRMPGMTGAELLAEIKRRFPRLVGMILSGYADMAAVIEALNSGAVFKYMQKPWDENDLLEGLHSAFQAADDKGQQEVGELGVHGLLSRLGLQNSLNDWLAAGVACTVVYLDVNKFQTFNDSLGYDDADNLLASIAQSLMIQKPQHGLLGRMSGDEFVLLLLGKTSTEQSEKIINNLLAPFQGLYSMDGSELHVSFSVGYAVGPDDGTTPGRLLKNAQAAVSSSKHSGSTCYPRYRAAMNEKSSELMRLRSDLYRALEKNQFSVVYQPKVCIITGKIIGAESLLRWQHDSLGMISPVTFIPLAESSGLIEPIGEWVLATATSQVKFWEKEGLPSFLLSVNLSGRQLQRNTLAEKVENILNTTGILPTQLELEITETFLMQDIDNSLKLLQDMKDLGIRIAIDDFGTGYSSLNYLSQLPIDTLKIDRSFVKEILTSNEKEGLVRNVIQMSHDLGMSVVAEGVETKAQLETLRKLNCDVIQGYFYSPPVSADKFRELLENQPLIGVEINQL